MTAFPDHEPWPPLEEPFVWTTNEGAEMLVTDMETSHLYHSLRMLWNHTIENSSLQLHPFRVRAGVSSWPADYRREAFDAFMVELPKRTLEPQWAADWAHMKENRAAMDRELARLSSEEWDSALESGDDLGDPFGHEWWLET